MSKNIKPALIIGSILVGLLIIVPAILGGISGWSGQGWGMMAPGMMWGIGGWWFMPILMIIFWGLVIWTAVALVRELSHSGGTNASGGTESALEILKKRYARGEINKADYEEKKKDLV